jgi:hypothetical protein
VLSDDNPALRPSAIATRSCWFAGTAAGPSTYQDLARLSPEDRRQLRQPHLTGLLVIAIAYLLLILMDFGINFIQKMTMEKAGHLVMHDLRLRLFDRSRIFP